MHARRRPTRAFAVALVLAAVALAAPAPAQVLRLAELNTEQIRALDRARTVVLVPGGILEEHGPYLPSYSDGYYNEHLTARLAEEIARRPGWTAVVFPVIPLGSGGANEVGGKHSFPGTYAVRPATLRAVFMDLATEFGEQGFRWIFVVHEHGSPGHNRALDDAADYFRDTFGGQMVHLTGLLSGPRDPLAEAGVPAEVRASDGFSVHAGLVETSQVQALRPDLVPASVARAPVVTGADFGDLRRIAGAPEWAGYFGAPRHTNVELGARLLRMETDAFVEVALRILDGLDPRQVPRYVGMIQDVPGIQDVMRASAERDRRVERRQQEWIDKQPPRSW